MPLRWKASSTNWPTLAGRTRSNCDASCSKATPTGCMFSTRRPRKPIGAKRCLRERPKASPSPKAMAPSLPRLLRYQSASGVRCTSNASCVPLTVAEQIESSVVYGLTAALYGQITIKDGRVVEGNFDDYPMLRIDGMPEVETHLALTGGTKWGGVGEPGVPPVAPAVCNAIFKITGRRVRSLPLSNHDLNWT